LSPDVWVPGAAEPSLDDLVARVLREIADYTGSHGAEQTHVEVELGDGQRLTLTSLSGEPGYGFLTLVVHPERDDDPERLIVPIGWIRRFALGPADETRRPGFALPERSGPGSAA
jgi:hypothetical protein